MPICGDAFSYGVEIGGRQRKTGFKVFNRSLFLVQKLLSQVEFASGAVTLSSNVLWRIGS